ncbi:MAG: dTMP kinase [Chitinispirillaceae bacterium]|nr:dTMP kinase [Chitinispirillaceae bacterium]
MSRCALTRGYFVTFEGVDGCGKSSQAGLLAKRLRSEGYAVVTTREPGGAPIAEKIRALLLDPAHLEMVNECEVLLYLAARAQHLREKIVPELERGAIVICDRFQDATFAYQGFGREVPLEQLRLMNSFATGGVDPDLTFIFDLPVEKAIERLAAMKKPEDRLEAGGRAFFERIRNGYRSIAADAPDRIVLLDGALPIEVLAEKVNMITAGKLKERSFLR